jgi:hypothetical protein
MQRLRAESIWGMPATIQFSLLSSSLLHRNVKVKTHTSTILTGDFYGHETWSLTIREEHRLRVFKNWVLRRTPGR